MTVPGNILPCRREGAFTLIELLVVVAVLAILFEFLFRGHARPVPYLQIAMGLWLLLTCALPALVRRWLFVYLFGVATTAGLLSYCMFYRGFELDGGLRALLGGFCAVYVYYLFDWLRHRKLRASNHNASPNGGPAKRLGNSGATGGPPSVS